MKNFNYKNVPLENITDGFNETTKMLMEHNILKVKNGDYRVNLQFFNVSDDTVSKTYTIYLTKNKQEVTIIGVSDNHILIDLKGIGRVNSMDHKTYKLKVPTMVSRVDAILNKLSVDIDTKEYKYTCVAVR